jgi:hypothetical protein
MRTISDRLRNDKATHNLTGTGTPGLIDKPYQSRRCNALNLDVLAAATVIRKIITMFEMQGRTFRELVAPAVAECLDDAYEYAWG